MNSCLIVNCNNLQLVNKKYLTGGEVLFLWQKKIWVKFSGEKMKKDFNKIYKNKSTKYIIVFGKTKIYTRCFCYGYSIKWKSEFQ